jgi:hypothetical protein
MLRAVANRWHINAAPCVPEIRAGCEQLIAFSCRRQFNDGILIVLAYLYRVL